MENKNQNGDVQKKLIEHLSKSNLSKEKLSTISKTIAADNQSRFRIIDWHWLGTPAFEKFIIEGELPLAQTAFLQNFYKEDIVKEIRLQRKGIPVPDFFNVVFEIENE